MVTTEVSLSRRAKVTAYLTWEKYPSMTNRRKTLVPKIVIENDFIVTGWKNDPQSKINKFFCS